MPELPEVETVVRDLRPLVVGRAITGVRQSEKKLRRPWKSAWNAKVVGSRIEAVRRRGKWILIDLQDRGAKPRGSQAQPLLRVHLGMTGQFTVAPASAPEPDHLHVVFSLDDGNELRLRDSRRFGSAEYFPDRTAVEAEMNAELGPEPFGIDPDYFRETVRGTSRNLKAILLDQKAVAGVGNIYADEALFRAKLHPGRAGKGLSPEECDRLREAIEAVMTKAIAGRGSTIRDYVGGSGLRGGFQNEFAVYGRTGEPCAVCGAPIKSARFAGRSSHYCPVCQESFTTKRAPAQRGRSSHKGPQRKQKRFRTRQ
jgi:formamidopyrimidine-DNA glycosylase